MSREFHRATLSRVVILVSIATLAAGPCWAVTSKITRQSSNAELTEGKAEGVVIGSRGTIQLGRGAKVLADEFEDVWSVNSVVVSGRNDLRRHQSERQHLQIPLGYAHEDLSGRRPADPFIIVTFAIKRR